MAEKLQQTVVATAFRDNEKAPKNKKRTDPELGAFFQKSLGPKQYLLNVANLRAMYNRGVLPWPADNVAKPPARRSRRYDWNGEVMEPRARYKGHTREEAKAFAKEQEKKDAAKKARARAGGKGKKSVAASGKGVKVRIAKKADRPADGNATRKIRSGKAVGKKRPAPVSADFSLAEVG